MWYFCNRKTYNELLQQAVIVCQKYPYVSKGKIILSMIYCMAKYGARPIDYARFEFQKKTSVERNRYMTINRYFIMRKHFDKELFQRLSGDKINEYAIYREFINREWKEVNISSSTAVIKDFLLKHNEAILKPNKGEQGHGVIKLSMQNINEILSSLQGLDKLYILEEVLHNSTELANINSSSLNTLRVYTLIDKVGKVHILAAMLRVGRSGGYVDNWGSGGIGYNLDLETGIVDQCGRDKQNNPYIYHPDTNVMMLGFQYPHWHELKEFVYALCRVEPKALFVGWDIALTARGFELVEMNFPGGHDFLQAFGTPFWDIIKRNIVDA